MPGLYDPAQVERLIETIDRLEGAFAGHKKALAVAEKRSKYAKSAAIVGILVGILGIAVGFTAWDTAADVREALHQVIDPELGIDVIDLGLVYGIEIDELGRAIITMTLTTPACPLTDLIEDECASTLAGLVEEFRIDWTWQPRWTMDKITPEGRDQLAALGFNFENLPKY